MVIWPYRPNVSAGFYLSQMHDRDIVNAKEPQNTSKATVNREKMKKIHALNSRERKANRWR